MNENSKKFNDVLSFFFAILAIHFLIISFIIHSKIIIAVSIIDSIIAIILGIRTNNNLGHAGIIIGIFTLVIEFILILISWD